MFAASSAFNISRMADQPLHIEELAGFREGILHLRLSGPLTLRMYLAFNPRCVPTSRAR
jgi:hypothetical protein